jgi:hypothetical protein
LVTISPHNRAAVTVAALLKRTVPSRKGNTSIPSRTLLYCSVQRNQYVAGQSRWGPRAKKILTLFVRSYHTMSASLIFLPFRSVGRNKYQKRPPLMRTSPCYHYPPAHRLLDSATLLPLAPYATSTPYLLPLSILPHHKSVEYSLVINSLHLTSYPRPPPLVIIGRLKKAKKNQCCAVFRF